MPTDKLNINAYDNGWTNGVLVGIDEAIADADAVVILTTVKNDIALFGLTSTVIVDADTVTGVTVTVRAATIGGGNDVLGIELRVGGVVIGVRQDSVSLTTPLVNYVFNDVAWDVDWTAAEIEGMEVRAHSRQSGMPVDAGHAIDCADIDIEYTLAGAAPFPYHMFKQARTVWKQLRLTL